MSAGISYNRRSLVRSLNKAIEDGFSRVFKIDGAALHYDTEKVSYQPGQVSLVGRYEFDETADPADNAVLYVLQTEDGVKGTLIDAAGFYASPSVQAFMAAIKQAKRKGNIF
ncbi:hypothetical protein [Deminuibacter soli]|uniref:Phosphoribosylpyrophosphate synthetase n=1 Tax=Deminuibacter soli TaxID=2291815 RepID=A0A3E1NLF2_9BACT|nr:hypothetical protein [Deminuibacter soli]RFM28618.1 hypothetical protein DXN05_07430 [Deminuibacter soli]